jgi:hypothetical protein
LKQEGEGEDKWAPFCNKEEWGLAEWLVKSLGQTRMDEILKLPIVSLGLMTIKYALTIVIDAKPHKTFIPQQLIIPTEGQ